MENNETNTNFFKRAVLGFILILLSVGAGVYFLKKRSAPISARNETINVETNKSGDQKVVRKTQKTVKVDTIKGSSVKALPSVHAGFRNSAKKVVEKAAEKIEDVKQAVSTGKNILRKTGENLKENAVNVLQSQRSPEEERIQQLKIDTKVQFDKAQDSLKEASNIASQLTANEKKINEINKNIEQKNVELQKSNMDLQKAAEQYKQQKQVIDKQLQETSRVTKSAQENVQANVGKTRTNIELQDQNVNMKQASLNVKPSVTPTVSQTTTPQMKRVIETKTQKTENVNKKDPSALSDERFEELMIEEETEDYDDE